MTIPAEQNKKDTNLLVMNKIDYILLTMVIIILVIISILLIRNLNMLNTSYETVIEGIAGDKTIDVLKRAENHSAILTFSRAKDFANMKASAMFVGFLLIFTGALYLIKVFNLAYSISVDKPAYGSMSLSSNSPGLIMITLGVIIILTVLIVKTEIEYEFEIPPIVNSDISKKIDSLVALYNSPRPTKSDNGLKESTTEAGNTSSVKRTKAIPTTRPFVKADERKSGTTVSVPENLPVLPTPVSPMKSFVQLTNDGQPLNEASRMLIEQLIIILKRDPSREITLEAEGSGESTQEKLQSSQDLANALKSILVSRKIAAARIKVRANGESRPSGRPGETRENVVSVLF